MINKIKMVEDVTLLTFENATPKIEFVSKLFGRVAEKQINVDMISQTSTKGNGIMLSFTANDSDLPQLLEITNIVKEKRPEIKTYVNPSNVKIALYSKDMALHYGVAAKVFEVLNEVGIDIILITTSEEDISILVRKSDAVSAYEALQKEFNL